MTRSTAFARCACGSVEIEAHDRPIIGVVCYCDDCQAAAQAIEQRPGAPPVRDPDGGTPMIVYRKDRVRTTKGASRLERFKLKEGSPTNRWVAACCNSAMFVSFDDARHWVDLFRARMGPDAPALEVRVCTRFSPGAVSNPEGLPSTAGYPPGLIFKLVGAKLAMIFAR